MRNIEITTTKKVTIQYPLAPLSDRILGFVIDLIILIVGTLLLSLLVGLASDSQESWQTWQYLIILPVVSFYTLAWEFFNHGQTPGKLAMGTRVIQLDGDKPALSNLILRWCFRTVDLWVSAGSLATILVSSSPQRQRLGGLLSNTAVVKVSKKSRISLNEILQIDSIEAYEVTYPEVLQFSEQDMLLIKSTLDRVNRFRNKAHQEAINELVVNVRDRLGVQPQGKSKRDFLRTLIRDYIVLTR